MYLIRQKRQLFPQNGAYLSTSDTFLIFEFVFQIIFFNGQISDRLDINLIPNICWAFIIRKDSNLKRTLTVYLKIYLSRFFPFFQSTIPLVSLFFATPLILYINFGTRYVFGIVDLMSAFVLLLTVLFATTFTVLIRASIIIITTLLIELFGKSNVKISRKIELRIRAIYSKT